MALTKHVVAILSEGNYALRLHWVEEVEAASTPLELFLFFGDALEGDLLKRIVTYAHIGQIL